MSKRYTQLTEAERYHIYTMKKQGYTDTVIAQGMGRDRTTIWRELQRNTGHRGYRHQQAQQWAVARHQEKPKRVKLTPEVQAVLRSGLAHRWSPEQIAGRRCRETGQRLSAETIYQYIARDKRAGGTLYRQLRYQGKPYRKKYGRTDYRGRIPVRVDIDQRPAIVAARTRLGDWDASQALFASFQEFLTPSVLHNFDSILPDGTARRCFLHHACLPTQFGSFLQRNTSYGYDDVYL